MRAWAQAFRIPTAARGRAQASIGLSCQPIAGYEHEMFSEGCTMNIGSKKLLREVASTFCGAQLSETEELVPSRVLFTLFQRDRIFGRDSGSGSLHLISSAMSWIRSAREALDDSKLRVCRRCAKGSSSK